MWLSSTAWTEGNITVETGKEVFFKKTVHPALSWAVKPKFEVVKSCLVPIQGRYWALWQCWQNYRVTFKHLDIAKSQRTNGLHGEHQHVDVKNIDRFSWLVFVFSFTMYFCHILKLALHEGHTGTWLQKIRKINKDRTQCNCPIWQCQSFQVRESDPN